MGKNVPTLSSLGWVNTVEEKGDFALSYFITSEYSQSVLYSGRIESLQYLVKRFGSDPLKLEEEIANSLEGLMTRYFDESATSRVEVSDPDPEKPQELTIRFWCIVRENDREYSLGRSVMLTDSRIMKIAKLNNG